MKKRFIFTMILLLVFSYNSISGYEHREEINIIEDLLNQRIQIMNEFLYAYKDMDLLEDKLSKIEKNNLLENDLDILKKVMDNPTDYELALKVKVHKINTLDIKDDEILINADLDWFMRSYDGEFNLIRNYNIECIQEDDQTFLSKLKILNNVGN
ncbi:MAG: hypothetical protein GX339_01740 [Tissierellia bacterium]|nr:hypothetical protein [Tissierellia bacterium]